MQLRRFVIFCLDSLWQPWFPKVFLRVVDQEYCYRRIPPGSVINNKVIPANAVTFPKPSCFRSRWSDPYDALHPKACNGRVLAGYGVIRFRARDVRRELKVVLEERALSLLFDVLPDPIRGCFAHCEISNEVTMPSGARIEAENFDEETRARMRAALAYRSEVVIAPRP